MHTAMDNDSKKNHCGNQVSTYSKNNNHIVTCVKIQDSNYTVIVGIVSNGRFILSSVFPNDHLQHKPSRTSLVQLIRRSHIICFHFSSLATIHCAVD